MRRIAAIAICVVSCLTFTTACIPYTVGTTAQPVPRGESSVTRSYFIIPNAYSFDDSISRTLYGMDLEKRYGLSEDSDLGIRLSSSLGVIATYKKRMLGEAHEDSSAWSYQVGAGFVNAFNHAHVEASLLYSGSANGRFLPYGGLRAMQVFPIENGAAHDTPTIGGFFGVRIGSARDAVLPELGIFYDQSTLGLRKSTIVFVPSINVRGKWVEAFSFRNWR